MGKKKETNAKEVRPNLIRQASCSIDALALIKLVKLLAQKELSLPVSKTLVYFSDLVLPVRKVKDLQLQMQVVCVWYSLVTSDSHKCIHTSTSVTRSGASLVSSIRVQRPLLPMMPS